MQKGLGYDIQSVWANYATRENQLEPDSVFYIEVKSTTRITAPKNSQNDSVHLTRNEYLAADQLTKSYAIYRVYLTPKGIYVYPIFNPLNAEEQTMCKALKYNYEFTLQQEVEKWS